MKEARIVLIVWVALVLLTAARYVLAATTGLAPDEAYYFLWSERLDWAYYSKGPGVAVAIWIGTSLFGPTELGVRFLSPLLALGSSLLLFYFARRIYDAKTGAWLVGLVNALPIFNVGGIVMTIDPLSIFFWIAATVTFWRALEKVPKFTGWWFLTGVLIGAGFLCKYTNAFQLLSVVLVLALVPRHRIQFLRLGFWTLLVGFSIGLVPPLIWNIDHSWITMVHLLDRGGISTGGTWNPLDFLEFLGVHLGVYSPLLFVGMVWAAVTAFKEARHHYRPRFLLCFALPIIFFYFGLSLKQAGEANWTAPGFVTLGLLAAAYWPEKFKESRLARAFGVAAFAIALLGTSLLLASDGVRQLGWFPWPYKADPGGRLRGWQTAAEALHQARLDLEKELGEPVFLIANKYGTAAALSFYLPEKRVEGEGHPPIYTPETQEIMNQYAFWPRYDEFIFLGGEPLPRLTAQLDFTEEAGVNPFMGRTALFVTDEVSPDGIRPKSAHEVKRGFEEFRRLGDIVIERRGQPVRTLRLFACFRYKSFDL